MYAIIDHKNKVVGKWFAGSHIVECYRTKQEAIADSKAYKFRTSVIKAEIAITLSPSKYSTK